MARKIFEHTDGDGDGFHIDHYPSAPGNLVLLAKSRAGTIVPVELKPGADVDRLRAALAPHGTPEPATDAGPGPILDLTDVEGDTLTVYTRSSRENPIALTINAETDDEQTVWLTPARVTELRAALASHDPAEVPTTGTALHELAERVTRPTAPVAAIEVGREYRLLPGAKLHTDFGDVSTGLATSGTTRVVVTNPKTRRGNATVTAVDGVNAGTPNWSVAPEFLAPLPGDAAEALWVLPDPADSLDPARVARGRRRRPCWTVARPTWTTCCASLSS
ncbi:hypothetical protein GA0070618_6695 [Micromonospora echinospora]|uniref:Uncharacterized protein n=1 Tax=Micromonospora echinospora TaxID=1877 RepID=A0A1C5AC56_MICEC|nr:hypothetical protein [Micromonospora echinospora]SCF42651.1 hypothetical protein GA0070618_6695 [Micromonospora echinospora]